MTTVEDEDCPRKSTIPEEIMYHRFSWLPTKSLMRFKCVSKFCNSLLSDEYFLDIYNSHSTKFLARSKNVEDVFIIDLKVGHRKISISRFEKLDYIMNPPVSNYAEPLFFFWCPSVHSPLIYYSTTAEFGFLPPVNRDYNYFYYYSFGFKPDEMKYKILMISYDHSSEPTRYWVLTLERSETWREIIDAPYFSPFGYVGVCIDGTIYFFGFYNDKTCVVAFNVSTENFRIISLWEDDLRDYLYQRFHSLVELEGKLAAAFLDLKEGNEMDFWILERSESSEEWVKRTITLPQTLSSRLNYYCYYFCITPDDEIMILSTDFWYKPDWICFYDWKKKSWRVEMLELIERTKIMSNVSDFDFQTDYVEYKCSPSSII